MVEHLTSNQIVRVRFSLFAYIYSSIAQSVVHLTVNQVVTGSSPVARAYTERGVIGNTQLLGS